MSNYYHVMKDTSTHLSKRVKWQVLSRRIRNRIDAESELEFHKSQDKKNSDKYFLIERHYDEPETVDRIVLFLGKEKKRAFLIKEPMYNSENEVIDGWIVNGLLYFKKYVAFIGRRSQTIFKVPKEMKGDCNEIIAYARRSLLEG